MRAGWVSSLGVLLGPWGLEAHSDPWRSAGTARPAPQVQLGKAAALPPNAVGLGKPQSKPEYVPPTQGTPILDEAIRTVGYSTRASNAPIIRGQSPDYPPGPPHTGAPAFTAGMDERYNTGVVVNESGGAAAPFAGGEPVVGDPFMSGTVGETCRHDRGWFESDHAFDRFASPVSSPSTFEDPRSLTEIKPIFMYQVAPNNNYAFRGADQQYFGIQARLALTEHWSVVINKLGGVAFQAGDGNIVGGDQSGFAEFWIGPKWTFLRCESTGTVAAVGLTFELPVGGSNVYQNTGDFSLRPYFSIAQSFGRSSYGSFNFMGTLGYSASVNSTRSDNFFTNLHLDYDIANMNKIFPFVEMSWTSYTKNGNANTFNFEGADLYNFGSSNVKGNNTLMFGPGVRYKFAEWAQIGTVFEFPIVKRQDIDKFRWTIDFILRY